MKLDKFQQYIKDEEIEADKNESEAKFFMWELESNFEDQYQELISDIAASLDMVDLVKNSIIFSESKTMLEVDGQIILRVNELINKTLKEIEDIEADDEFEPEDCCDAHKRAQELKQ